MVYSVLMMGHAGYIYSINSTTFGSASFVHFRVQGLGLWTVPFILRDPLCMLSSGYAKLVNGQFSKLGPQFSTAPLFKKGP